MGEVQAVMSQVRGAECGGKVGREGWVARVGVGVGVGVIVRVAERAYLSGVRERLRGQRLIEWQWTRVTTTYAYLEKLRKMYSSRTLLSACRERRDRYFLSILPTHALSGGSPSMRSVST